MMILRNWWNNFDVSITRRGKKLTNTRNKINKRKKNKCSITRIDVCHLQKRFDEYAYKLADESNNYRYFDYHIRQEINLI